ncbi:MAG: polar growth protein [Cirrosporium novae-zelandiae]|nr:MAG: polar growth protein [Cirrosporium novae-zelandiae]
MAFRYQSLTLRRPSLGDVLIVMHDFEARSPDEISFTKGDRIELIERDDDFGDVYTAPVEKEQAPLNPSSQAPNEPENPTDISESSIPPDSNSSNSRSERTPQPSPHSSLAESFGTNGPAPLPLYSSAHTSGIDTPPNSGRLQTVAPSSLQRSLGRAIGNDHGQGEESPVMNETLSVIEEHITDLNTPRQSVIARERQGDSGSDYSSHIDHRLSCITGHETDEEENGAPTEEEIMTWSSIQTAEYLREHGVENHHCEVFQEQEISGEVLLSMDQASLFLKEFDLGPVGRRLRTWHKIKAIQQDAKSRRQPRRQSENGSPHKIERSPSKAGSHTSVLPRVPNLMEDSSSRPPSQRTQSSSQTSVTVQTSTKNQERTPRPSPASIREINQSQHPSIDATAGLNNSIDTVVSSVPQPTSSLGHHFRIPSFDRGWSMSTPVHSSPGRPSTSLAISRQETGSSTEEQTCPSPLHSPDISLQSDPDRGYFSGGEVENRKSRNVLRKRDSMGTPHSRQSSYNSPTDSKKRKSASSTSRPHKLGSLDSLRDASPKLISPAAKAYFSANMMGGRFRSASARDSAAPLSITLPSPTVTNLEPGVKASSSLRFFSRQDRSSTSDRATPVTNGKTQKESGISKLFGLRAASDAITEGEKTLVASPLSITSPNKDSPLDSPAKTGSNSPSLTSQSIELETDNSSKGTGSSNHILPSPNPTAPSVPPARRSKSKKETSAYTRGLEHKTPAEQMVDCDYSGWMKKKSSNLMTTWKPRLFILRGRRLSYYYSENDTEEKGLIDISNHKVLPASGDFLTGLHATITRATSTPSTPSQGTTTPTAAATDAATSQAQQETTTSTLTSEDPSQPRNSSEDAKENLREPTVTTTITASPSPNSHGHGTSPSVSGNSTFIFKLVPPRSGLSRAVNFTKPTVHYFAVDSIVQGRSWMGALIKATIQRDEDAPVTTTYTQKTISLEKARKGRARPPALMAEALEEQRNSQGSGQNESVKSKGSDKEGGLRIVGLADEGGDIKEEVAETKQEEES